MSSVQLPEIALGTIWWTFTPVVHFLASVVDLAQSGHGPSSLKRTCTGATATRRLPNRAVGGATWPRSKLKVAEARNFGFAVLAARSQTSKQFTSLREYTLCRYIHL